jgi:DNA polymerase
VRKSLPTTRCGGFNAVPDHAEPDVLAIDRAVNERGICFDPALAERLLATEDALLHELATSAERLTGGGVKRADLNRRDFLLEWLRARGVQLADLKKDTVARQLKRGDLDPAALAVLLARLAAGKKGLAKLRAGASRVSPDGRVRDQLVYHGGHTGRWTGRGVQPQNLPKPHPKLPADLRPLIEATGNPDAFRRALPAGVPVADGLSTLIRPCFMAAPGKVLLVADYAGIEARVLAWLAGERQLLDAFVRGEDPYCQLASAVFGRPVTKADKAERQVGKVAVLGLGYQMGAGRFAQTCASNGIDLAAAGTSAEAVVNEYRRAFPAIAGRPVGNGEWSWHQGGIWRDLGRAAVNAVSYRYARGRVGPVGRCRLGTEEAPDGRTLVIDLPGGRALRYRQARVEERVPGYARGDSNPCTKPTLLFTAPELGDKKRKRNKGKTGAAAREEVTYGGQLTENVTQATARDLLAHGLLALEREGLPVVLHVHDEVVCEVDAARVPELLRRMAEALSTLPPWAAGLPVEVEAFASERYVKVPPPGTLVVRARGGVVIDSGTTPAAMRQPAVTSTPARVPAVPRAPVAPTYHLGNPDTSLYVGNCRDVLPTLTPGTYRAGFFDPPFNVGFDYPDYDDNLPEPVYLGILEDAFRETARLLTPDGSLFVQHTPRQVGKVMNVLERAGLCWVQTIIWHFTFGVNTKARLVPSHQVILHYAKDPDRFVFNQEAIRVASARQTVYRDTRAKAGGKTPDDVWFLRPQEAEPRGFFSPEGDAWHVPRVPGTSTNRAAHSCQTPLPILDRIIRMSTDPGDRFLDGMAATCTSLVAARQLGRKSIGIELSPATAETGWNRVLREAP